MLNGLYYIIDSHWRRREFLAKAGNTVRRPGILALSALVLRVRDEAGNVDAVGCVYGTGSVELLGILCYNGGKMKYSRELIWYVSYNILAGNWVPGEEPGKLPDSTNRLLAVVD